MIRRGRARLQSISAPLGWALLLLALVGQGSARASTPAAGPATGSPAAAENSISFVGATAGAERPASSSVIALSADGRRLVTVITDSNSITIIDTLFRTPMIEVGVGKEPRTVALDPRGLTAFAAKFGDASISVIDVALGEVIATIGTERQPYGVVVSPDGQSLYVSEAWSGTIAEFDTGTLARRRSIPVEANPRELAVSADGRRLFVTHFLTVQVSLIDLGEGSVRTVVSTGSESNAAQFIATHPSGEKAYLPHIRSRVSNPDLQFDTTIAPVVSVIDLERRALIEREELGLDAIDRPVNMPFALAFSLDGGTLYSVNSGSNDLSIIDLETGAGVGHVELGDNPRGIVLTNNGRVAYIANSLSDDVSVVDLAGQKTV